MCELYLATTPLEAVHAAVNLEQYSVGFIAYVLVYGFDILFRPKLNFPGSILLSVGILCGYDKK